MGWAIRRADGTYRAWSRHAMGDALRAGETLEEHATMPAVTTEPTPPSPLAAALARARASRTMEDVLEVLALLVGPGR